MHKNFVLDTNVLLHDPYAMYKFEDNTVLIPIVVVEEVDKFKRDPSETGRNARTVSRLLDLERQKGKLAEGVPLEGGGRLQVVLESDPVQLHGDTRHSADNWILGVAVAQKKKAKDPCHLVTKDANLRIKADAFGVIAEDYSNDKVRIDELYTGHTRMEIPASAFAQIEESGVLQLPDTNLVTNQFASLVHAEEPERELLARYREADHSLHALDEFGDVWGISPRNMEQRCALELLLDPKVKLVSLIGKAGTGKTLLAIAAGLNAVADDSVYRSLLVSRPVQPLGKDIGFLPGDIDEKIRPWMQPIFDNLDYILSCSGSIDSYKGQPSYEFLLDKGWIVVEPLTYMRGRSIPNQYMIIDESQNLTPHEIKSIITRAGHGTKIVLTGDPYQIDHPFLDASTNGVSYVVNRLKGQDIYGHMSLYKGERSELAELASNLL